MKSLIKSVAPEITTLPNGQATFAGPVKKKNKTSKQVFNEYVDIESEVRFAPCCQVCGGKTNLPHKITGIPVTVSAVFHDGNPNNRLRSNITLLCQSCLKMLPGGA